MFEKDAEEWADEMYPCDGQAQRYLLMGAEFGYNKAKEWHKPSEKLPTKDCEVLIEYGENKAHRVVDWNNKSQYFGGFSIDEVTCWKEIVLPKENE